MKTRSNKILKNGTKRGGFLGMSTILGLMKKLSPEDLKRVHAFISMMNDSILKIPGKRSNPVEWYKNFSIMYHNEMKRDALYCDSNFENFYQPESSSPKLAWVRYILCYGSMLYELEKRVIIVWMKNQIKTYVNNLVNKNKHNMNTTTIDLKRDLDAHLKHWRENDVTVLYALDIISDAFKKDKILKEILLKENPRAMFILGLNTPNHSALLSKNRSRASTVEEVTGITESANNSRASTPKGIV